MEKLKQVVKWKRIKQTGELYSPRTGYSNHLLVHNYKPYCRFSQQYCIFVWRNRYK